MMRYLFLPLIAALCLLQGCVVPVIAAGVGAGAYMTATDRRSAGAIIEDNAIGTKAQNRIEEKYKDTAHVSVTAFNRIALITGTAVNEETKMDIERIVGGVPNVKRIANEVVVDNTLSSSGGSDALVTGNVKMRFVNNSAFKSENVKVVTDGGMVYLMGMVTHAEADAASEVASTTSGVKKVVRVFEYID
jgi:osmotically-inducible protein OsmY